MKLRSKSGFGAALLLALAAAMFTTTVQAQEDPGPGVLVWQADTSERAAGMRTARYGLGEYPRASTRLENELQASIGVRRISEAVSRMDRLVANPSEAERLFGRGYRVQRKDLKPRQVWDQYVDTVDGALDAVGASMRFRTENGVTGMNYKPPGSVRFPNGMAHRVEGGILVPASQLLANFTRPSSRLLAFFRNPRLRDNPLRHVGQHFRGRDVADFFNAAVDIRQVRHAYEIQRLEGGQWVPVSEMTIDRVTARDASNPELTTTFGRVELEGEHLNLVLSDRQRAALAAAGGGRPHVASDVHHPTFTQSPEVQEVHSWAEALTGYLEVRPSGQSKYSEARSRLAATATRRGITTPLAQGQRQMSEAARRAGRAVRTQGRATQQGAQATQRSRQQRTQSGRGAAQARAPRVRGSR